MASHSVLRIGSDRITMTKDNVVTPVVTPDGGIQPHIYSYGAHFYCAATSDLNTALTGTTTTGTAQTTVTISDYNNTAVLEIEPFTMTQTSAATANVLVAKIAVDSKLLPAESHNKHTIVQYATTTCLGRIGIDTSSTSLLIIILPLALSTSIMIDGTFAGSGAVTTGLPFQENMSYSKTPRY